VERIWPGLPLQLCHFHYVRDVGKDVFEQLEAEVRRHLLGTRVLARLNELTPGKAGDWEGSGRKCATELEAVLEEAEPRWVRILQDHVLGPRERASRFPFELTYGSIAQHAGSAAPLAHELAMWNVGRNVALGSLTKADGLLRKLAKDGKFTRLAHRAKTLTEAFDEYREALGVGRDVTGSDGDAASVAAEEGRHQVEGILARWEGVAEGLDDEEVRQGVRQMREAWEKRKGNLFVEVRDLRGEVRTIERTNWRSEQGHREVRLSIRGRTRKGRTEEEMERHENAVETSRGSVYTRAMTVPLFGLPKVRVAVVVNPRRKMEAREARDLALLEWEKGVLSKGRIEELKRELRVQNPKLRAKKRYAPGLLIKSAGRRGAEVDPEAVQRDRARDGRFLVFSTDLSLSGREMYETYFARDGIEKVFRTGKGELHLEPIRKQRLDRMYASATVLYTAWLLWSWTERTLKRKLPKMSLAEALRLLEKVPWVRSSTGKSVREGVPRLSGRQEEILTALGATRYLPVV